MRREHDSARKVAEPRRGLWAQHGAHEAIIAIVYLPVLALLGIEGKLFRPMATTVLLALAGAFLFSLTVVPVLTSYLVRPREGAHETWLLRKAHALYGPALALVMRRRWPSKAVKL